MNISIKGTNLELTDKIYKLIETKVGRFWKYIDEGDESVHLDIEIEKDAKHRRGNIYRVELQFRLPGKIVRAEDKGSTWRTAFDKAEKKARRELKDYKDKKSGLLRKNS